MPYTPFLRAVHFAIALTIAIIPSATHAAAIRFQTDQPAYRPDTTIEASVYLDTEGEEINAVEGVVHVSGEQAVIENVRDGGSMVPLWARRLVVTANGRVPFVGVLPGGMEESNLLLFRVLVRKDAPGKIVLDASDLRVLRNDGAGTAVSVRAVPYVLDVSFDVPEAGSPARNASRDREPPESFTPLMTTDAQHAPGAHALVFLAQDKGSGVDHYEVFETPRSITRASDIRWEPVESPYILQDQTLGSFIYVKAVDHEGNERIVRVDPRRSRAWYEQPDLLPVGVLAVGVIVLLGYYCVSFVWRGAKHPWEA